jgi:nucleoside-diphosphate-sugar epimerase
MVRMRYFVTGGTGFIGGRVVRQLVEAGHQVTALARNPARATDLQQLGVTLREGDVTDRASLRGPMEGADGIFHIAGSYRFGWRYRETNHRINVEGTRNVLETMRELAIPRGVYTSTLAINSNTHGRLVDETYRYYGPWVSEYDHSKWQAHYEVAEPLMWQGLPLVIVQPGGVYGPGDTSALGETLREYLRRRLPMVPSEMAFCWGYVDDTAHGHLLAMEKGRVGESYIIAGPPHTLVDVLAAAERITGIPAPRIHPPAALLGGLAPVASLVERVVPLPEMYTAESLRVMGGVTYLGSNEKARRELGFDPRPLEEGLRETLEYEMNRLGIKPARH